ncbi:MAG: hypothetical protein JWN25_1208 [Verrucomicrobiales bacterium]|nr:hypothetical protein [Verrucomicrobiales bacterium]
MPIFYECDRCTACCRWPGQVKVTDPEITAISAELKLSEFDFIQSYTRIHSSKTSLALKDKGSGECVFLEDGNCVIQKVKPQQCRDFPNLWNFPGFEKVCRAKPVLLNNPEYRTKVHAATGRLLEPGRNNFEP